MRGDAASIEPVSRHPGAGLPSSQTGRRMVKARLARPILVLARALPTVRMTNPMMPFWWAKGCSTAHRILDLAALAREVFLAIGLPGGLRRWMQLRFPRLARYASLAWLR